MRPQQKMPTYTLQTACQLASYKKYSARYNKNHNGVKRIKWRVKRHNKSTPAQQ